MKTFVELANSEKLQYIIPPVTYKYRDWDKDFHKSILTKQEIYFSSAYEFEDELDCRFPVEFDFSYEDIEKRMLFDFKGRKDTTLNLDQIKSLAKYAYKERFDTTDKRESRRKQFYELFNHSIGIYCVSCRNDNTHMWKKYANDFNGICVGTAFYDCRDELLDSNIGGRNINYVDENFPPLKYVGALEENKDYALEIFFMDMVFTKYDSWSQEEEFRLFKIFIEDRLDKIPTSSRLLKIPKPCFKEIIFGANLSPQSKREIVIVCDQEGLNVKFSVACPDVDNLVRIDEY